MATPGAKPVYCELIRGEPLKLEDGYLCLYSGPNLYGPAAEPAHCNYPEYTSVVALSGNMLIVVDTGACQLRLHSCQNGHLLAISGSLKAQPHDICLLESKGTQVAVTLVNGKIEILSVESTDKSTVFRQVWTSDAVEGKFKYCQGVTALKSGNKLVVSGGTEDKEMQRDWICWGIVSLDNSVKSDIKVLKICESVGGGYGSSSYLATNSNDSTVYISCWTGPHYRENNGVYAFDVKEGRRKFIYHHHELNMPKGICVDRWDFIYVCNLIPPCIHQLTESREPVIIHRMPPLPLAMCWAENWEELYVTSMRSKEIWRLHPQWNEEVFANKESSSTNEKQHLILGEQSVLSDKEAVHLWAKENSINVGALDELLKEGFTSMKALKYLEPSDLVNTNIPRGQQKLIIASVKQLTEKDTVHVQSTQSECMDISLMQRSLNGIQSAATQLTDPLMNVITSTSLQLHKALSIGIEDPDATTKSDIPQTDQFCNPDSTSVLVCVGHVHSTVHSNMETLSGKDSQAYQQSEAADPVIPVEVLKMDTRSLDMYKEALRGGTEKVYSIRVMVVGQYGVGKTTLTKRLLGKDVNISERKSTEGIDVHIECSKVDLSSGEWTAQEKSSELDYRLQRLAKVLKEKKPMRDRDVDGNKLMIKPQKETNPDGTTNVREEEHVTIPQGNGIHDSDGAHVAVEDNAVEGKDTEVLYHHSPPRGIDQNLSSMVTHPEESHSVVEQRKHDHQSDTFTVARSQSVKNIPSGINKIDPMKELIQLLQENTDKLKQDTGKNSPVSVWDFAGQYSFYTTHQTFLTRRAIYLLVSDVSGHISDLVDDDCYFDSEGIMKCRVCEVINIWLNSIHTCAPSPEAGIPPVILVGTHVDKISKKKLPLKVMDLKTKTITSETAEFTLPTTSKPTVTVSKEYLKPSTVFGSVRKFFKLQKTKGTVESTPVSSTTGADYPTTVNQPKKQKKWKLWQKTKKAKEINRHEICERYFRDIRSYLSDKPTRFHLINEDFAIDNSIIDSRLEDLKRKIVEVASQQSYWAEERPTRWILLEQELMRLKVSGIKVIPFTVLEKLNQAGAVPIATEELDLFLRFQHEIGTILYFSMEVLKDKIVLDPQWMIDALKSLITAEMFILRNTPAVLDKWFEFKNKGKLSQELIDAIWTKENNPSLHDNKEHILLLMEKLNIIATPRSYKEDGDEIKVENYFLAPCMLVEKTPREVIFPEPQSDMECSSVLCYIFIGKFLPPPIFHRLLATCVSHWPIANKKNENLIFCGCCVFKLDIHHKLTVFFKDYMIFARVTRIGTTDMTPSSQLCIEVREFITMTLTNVIGCLGQSLQFELSVQCPKYAGYSVDSMIPVADLQGNVEVLCDFHDNSHVIKSHDVLKFWFQEEESSVAGSAAPLPLPATSDTDMFMRMAYLMVDVGSQVLRRLFHHHTITPTCTLDQYLANNRNSINGLYNWKTLNQSQMDIMFPPSGSTDLENYDITLLSTLFTHIVRPSKKEKKLIKSLKEDRNEIYAHASSCKMNIIEYQACWNSVTSTLISLSKLCGDPNFETQIMSEIQHIQVTTVPAGSYLNILKTWFNRIDTVEDELQDVKSRLDALELKDASPNSDT